MIRRILLLSFVLTILFTFIYSEECDSTNCNSKLNIQSKSKALQFSIEPDFQLGSFQGSTISIKKHLSEKRALRYGISLTGGNTISESNRKIITNDSLNLKNNSDNSSYSFTLMSQYLIYKSTRYSYLFYGLGPIFRYTNQIRESETKNNLTGDWESSDINDRNTKSYYYGLSFVFGVEVFVSKTISIHGEYCQELTYRNDYYEEVRPTQITENSTRGFSVDGGQVDFGCSFYW
ncbi:hypothetical protein KKA87_03400 [bacterium]|nr:hypothetical protein [bacterium]MBU1873942.1 hypothetical protein [bacterium]